MSDLAAYGPRAEIVEEPFERILPMITERNQHFWEGGADGQLHLLRCQACGQYLHPPRPVCSRCRSFDVRPSAVSGRGRIYSYTVNHYTWVPGFEPPYVVAQVDLDDAEGVRLLTNIVRCNEPELQIDMAVEVLFARHDSVHIPLFQPARSP